MTRDSSSAIANSQKVGTERTLFTAQPSSSAVHSPPSALVAAPQQLLYSSRLDTRGLELSLIVTRPLPPTLVVEDLLQLQSTLSTPPLQPSTPLPPSILPLRPVLTSVIESIELFPDNSTTKKMTTLFEKPRVYYNMNHSSYQVGDTTFDDTLTAGHGDASPLPEKDKSAVKGSETEKKYDDEHESDQKVAGTPNNKKRGSKKSKHKKKKSSVSSNEGDSSENKGTGKDEKPSSAKDDDSSTKAKDSKLKSHSSTASSSSSIHGSDNNVSSEAESVFSQLLLESIFDQKSVPDFINGLPDKRGTLLIRYPTTILSSSWKKRYFTLHGDCLYLHEDQNVIHPSSFGMTGSMLAGSFGAASNGATANAPIPAAQVNYKDCKSIKIEEYYIIQQDENILNPPRTPGGSESKPTTPNGTSLAANLGSNVIPQSTLGQVLGSGQVIGAGHKIPSALGQSAGPVSPPTTHNFSASLSAKNKFEELFKKNQKSHSPSQSGDFSGVNTGSIHSQNPLSILSSGDSKDKHTGSNVVLKKSFPQIKNEEERAGPVVHGRRRSSLVNIKGKVRILLISKVDKKADPIELTGLNEGSIADYALLNEWILAINARISILNFLHSPMTLTSMTRGGREILAFLTDSSSKILRIENKFTDLHTVLTHFHGSLIHRGGEGIQIIFKNCAMTDMACKALCRVLEENTLMQVDLLDLSSNMLTKESCAGLYQVLRKNKRIKALVLDKNQIGDAGLDVLVNGPKIVAPPSLTMKVTGVSNGGTPTSEPTLATTVDDPPRQSIWTSSLPLHTLSFQSNQITDTGMEQFLTSILDYLRVADMEKECEEDDETSESENEDAVSSRRQQQLHHGASCHAHFFKSLNFASNNITDLGVQVLSAFLIRNPSIHSLNLSKNFLTDSGVAHLKEILEDYKRALRILNLSHNQITSIGMKFIVDALKHASVESTKAGDVPNKLEMDLSGNDGIENDGIQELLSLYHQSSTLPQEDSRKIPTVHFKLLAFSVFDKEILEERRVNGCVSPRPRASNQHHSYPDVNNNPNAASSSSGVAVTPIAQMSVSQRNVLDLFSPTTTGKHAIMQYPPIANKPAAETKAPAAATTATPQQNHDVLDLFGINPNQVASKQTKAEANSTASATPAAAASSSSSSSTIPSAVAVPPSAASTLGSPPSHPTPKKKKKGDRNARENDISAPRVAIAPHSGAPKPKITVAPLHPPPQFAEVQPSPDGGQAVATPASQLVSPATGTPAVSIVNPTPTAHGGDHDEVDEPNSLIPAQFGQSKPKGVAQ